MLDSPNPDNGFLSTEDSVLLPSQWAILQQWHGERALRCRQIQPSCQREMFDPEMVVQAGNHDIARIGTGCVDKLIVAHINSDMGNPVRKAEKHQIARMQILESDAVANFAQGF